MFAISVAVNKKKKVRTSSFELLQVVDSSGWMKTQQDKFVDKYIHNI